MRQFIGAGLVALVVTAGAPRALAEVVVVEVPPRSAADRAGVRVGDVLRTWSRRGAVPVEFGSPFEAARVEIEELPFGPIEIAGERNGQPSAWTEGLGGRGLVTRPRLGPQAEVLFEEGQALAAGGDHAAATAAWRRAGDAEVSPVSKAWLRLWEGRACGKARQTAQTNAAFEDAVRQLEAHDAIAAAQVLREWGALVTPWGELDRAAACYERARDLDARRGESLSLAGDWAGLAWTERIRGRIPVATELAQHALAMRASLAPEGLDVAFSLNDLGALSLDSRDFEAAEPYHRRALAIRQRLDPDGMDVARSLNNLGIARDWRGDPEQAERYYRESLRLKQELHASAAVLSSAFVNLGALAMHRGRLTEAEEYLTQALKIHEAAGALALAAGVLTNLGLIASQRFDYAAATTYQRRALAIHQAINPESPHTCGALQNLGLALHGAGDLEGARSSLERAVELTRKAEPDSLSLAYVLTDLADLDIATDDLERAERESAEARGLYERLGPISKERAVNLGQAGRLALTRGDAEAAGRFFDQALALWRGLAPGSMHEAAAVNGLARTARAKGDAPGATHLFCQAVEALEQQRAHLGSSDERRLGFGVRFAPQYRECLDGLIDEQRTMEAFQVLERARARSLLTLLAERDLVLDRDSPQVLLQEARALDREYDGLVERISQLDSEQRPQEEPALVARQRELRDRRTALPAELRRVSPRLGSLAYPEPLSYRAAQHVLDVGTVLLSYDVGTDGVRLFVLSPREDEPAPTVFNLPVGEQALREKVNEYLRLVRRRDAEGATALARELYSLLVAPAESSLRRSRRVLIAPDGALHLLPFGSLVRSPAGTRPSYLVEWRPVHAIASATLYAEILRSRSGPDTRPPTLTAFGDPLTASWKEGDGTRSVDTSLRSALKDGLPPLPAARDEVREIARLFPGAAAYVGDQATEERAKQLDTGVRYVHFACHALLDKRQPLNSALVLSHPVAGGESENGLLQAWEIFESVRLNADLVTLSACDTGLGQDIGGEGLASLTRAFTYAGARSVLASHWRVLDTSTQVLMRRFYKEMRAGRPKDEALQRAQVALIHDKRYALPFHWAAFQLSGDWR